ncbi:MAG: type II toxin-antitoxin system VapC family toxin [Acetobacteraceae bacterium]
MLAVDTNVLVRVVTIDDPRQSRRAQDLVDGNDIWVSTTVLLETEWVLRSLYQFTPGQIVAALRNFAGLSRVSLEDATLAAQALDWCEQGMDFADALHLAAAGHCEAFATFDKDCIKIARKAGLRVREP